MKIFETHAHYDDERFDEDRDELISSMLSDTGELDYIVNVGASRQGLSLIHISVDRRLMTALVILLRLVLRLCGK